MRSLGTRVCIFCSRTLTRALISETICTPLLFVAVIGTPPAVLVELKFEMLRLLVGRDTGVRGGKREGVVERDGTVMERARDGETALGGGGNPDLGECSPDRCSVGCPVTGGLRAWVDRDVTNGTDTFTGASRPSDKSERHKSGGAGVLRRLSSDTEDVTMEDAEVDSVSVNVGKRDCTAASWSFMMVISSLASIWRGSAMFRWNT